MKYPTQSRSLEQPDDVSKNKPPSFQNDIF